MGRPKKSAPRHVIKASAAIQIHGNITFLQRRAWNVLLAHAYDVLLETARHRLPLVSLMQQLEFDSKNEDYLKEALRGLVQCQVEWNLLEKEADREWGIAALLAEVTIGGGICTYEYTSSMRERLANPRMYARLCLSLQNHFTSKYALALWELCTDYLGSKRDSGETPWIALDDFRKLLGIADSPYYTAFFKKLNQQILTPALADLHRVADFRVTVAYQRQGRKVLAVKLQMHRVVLAPEAGAPPSPLVPVPAVVPAVVQELQAAGLALHEAWDLWRQGFAAVAEEVRPAVEAADTEAAFTEYVREKLHLLTRRQAAGKVEHTTGFLREALRKNYANPEYAAAKQRVAHRVQHEAAAALAEQQAALEAARAEALQTLASTLIAEQPALLEQAVAWALHDAPGFHLVYRRECTALENYRGRVAVQAVLTPFLERQAPERFAAVRERYAAALATLADQRRTLPPA